MYSKGIERRMQVNELLWFAFLIMDLSVLLLMFRFFGKFGLYVVITYSIILCNIQVLKIVELFGLMATLGNVLYGSIFLATDILGEVYGKEHARKGVYIGFISLIIMTAYMQMALLFKPAEADFIDPHIRAIFSLMPRIMIASLTAYLVSQLHDVWAFHFWKKKTHDRHLWLRNNLSTLVSQFIDSLIFCAIAFMGLYDLRTWFDILITTYFLKMMVAVLDTPFIYLAKRVARVAENT